MSPLGHSGIGDAGRLNLLRAVLVLSARAPGVQRRGAAPCRHSSNPMLPVASGRIGLPARPRRGRPALGGALVGWIGGGLRL